MSAPSVVQKFWLDNADKPNAGRVNINSGANVTARTTSLMGALRFPGTTNTGQLTLRPKDDDPIRVLTVRTLSMGSPTVGGLDLTDGGMIVNFRQQNPSQLNDIRAYITSAYAAGAWTGSGIRSSTAANSPLDDGIGYAAATDFTTVPSQFLGEQFVVPTSVLVRYTYYGDTNLDGVVNLQDFNRLAANFGHTDRDWFHGDSNYDRLVNLSDFNQLAANFGLSSLGPGEDDGGGRRVRRRRPALHLRGPAMDSDADVP